MPRFPVSLFHRRSRAVGDLEQAMSLGLPVLGAIRAYEADASGLPDGAHREPLDAYGLLADAVRLPEFQVRGRVVLVTSAEAGDGSVAMNLATLLARGGSKVVLVEADLRQAARRRVGDGSTSSGFAGLLVNQLRTASSAVVHTLEPKLKLLPVGSVTRAAANLLRSPRLPLVMDQLRELADHVIIVAPSVLDWEETLNLVHQADMTLLVVEIGRTSRNDARHAVMKLKAANAGTLGLVLTQAPQWLKAPRVEAEPVPAVKAAPVVLHAPEKLLEPHEQGLELVVGDLLAELEDTLRLIRSLRRPGNVTHASEQDEDAEFAASER